MKTEITKKKINNKGGFSLVEMLVAIAVFMSIMTIAISALITIISANKKAQAIKSTVDTVNFAMETISRDMRVGSSYKCLAEDTPGSDCLGGSNSVQYTNSDGVTTTYTFNKDTGPVITETKSDSPNTPIALISRDSNVNIDNMTFYVIGADCESGVGPSCGGVKTQPRVIITISGSISVNGSSDVSSFNLQTSISQRSRQ